jgi:hypothetical protein
VPNWFLWPNPFQILTLQNNMGRLKNNWSC